MRANTGRLRARAAAGVAALAIALLAPVAQANQVAGDTIGKVIVRTDRRQGTGPSTTATTEPKAAPPAGADRREPAGAAPTARGRSR